MELSFVIKVPNRLNLGKTQEFVLQVLETGFFKKIIPEYKIIH